MRPGGVERSLVSFLHAIDYAEHTVDLLLFEGGGAYLDQIPQEVNVKIVDLQPTYGGLLPVIGKLMKQGQFKLVFCKIILTAGSKADLRWMKWLGLCGFSRNRYDRVFAYRVGIPAEYAAFSVKADKKYVWWHHGDFHYEKWLVQRWDRVFREIGNIVCVSNGTRKLIEENFEGLNNSICVIPNIVPVDEIKAQAAEYNPYAEQKKVIRLVTVGRFSEEKRMIDAVYTAEKLLASDFNAFEWYLVGDGVLLTQVREEVRSRRLEKYIKCVGEKENPYPYMAKADIYVHLSRVESQGLTILEAMSLRVPCVVVRSAGPSEYLRDRENALLVPSDPAEIADRILLLIKDRQVYEAIKERTRCPERFLESTVKKQIEELLEG